MSDTFRIIAPAVDDNTRQRVVRIPPDTYRRVRRLSAETGVSICLIVDQCVAFALERLEGDKA